VRLPVRWHPGMLMVIEALVVHAELFSQVEHFSHSRIAAFAPVRVDHGDHHSLLQKSVGE